MRKYKNRYFYHILVSLRDAHGAIMLNVVWMEREFWCFQIVLQHVSIYLQQFPSYSNRKCKKRHFHVPQPTFLFPLETPLGQSR